VIGGRGSFRRLPPEAASIQALAERSAFLCRTPFDARISFTPCPRRGAASAYGATDVCASVPIAERVIVALL
jgi:hypothetical protein